MIDAVSLTVAARDLPTIVDRVSFGAYSPGIIDSSVTVGGQFETVIVCGPDGKRVFGRIDADNISGLVH